LHGQPGHDRSRADLTAVNHPGEVGGVHVQSFWGQRQCYFYRYSGYPIKRLIQENNNLNIYILELKKVII